ncbi:MAG: hypothetical protein D6679_08090 [Candidatus Hydrogenedentota bacterium]|nr:MAG: hypothetical protein D6679_08090 [Candidatus Hydrogenedentota bacterium]
MTSPFSTRRKTSAIEASKTIRQLCPKCAKAAAWVKVALGPRIPTVKGCSNANDAPMISR